MDSRAQDNRSTAPVPTGGLFNPKGNLYEIFWGPGGARDKMHEKTGLADPPEWEETLP